MTLLQQNLLQKLKENPFVLAPMAGITDHAFRTFMRKRGAGIVVSELVSATGIEHKSERTLALMSFEEAQRPVGIQLFGEDPEVLARAAQLVEQMGADFVDLNFGCPVPKVVKKGAGSAMLRDLPLMEKVLGATVKAVQIPVTIKIRTGWDSSQRNARDVCQLAFDQGITWVAIHGRTRAQGYSGEADWNFIGEVQSQSPLPVLGNGDILNAEQANLRLQESGCAGVLIGRGALKNPLIFQQALALYQGHQLEKVASNDYKNLFLDLKSAIVARCDDRIVQIQLKKFAAWFATGYPHSAQFRKSLFQSQSTDQVTDLTLEYFGQLGQTHQENKSHEGFLMGGHG